MNKNSLIGFAVGPLVGALLGLATVPMVAWIFTPEDLGRFNVLQISLSFVLLISLLGLDQAYVREYHEAKNKQLLLLSCFFPGFLFLLVVGGLSLFFASDLAWVLYGESDPVYYVLTLLIFFVSFASCFFSLILRMQERGWAYSASQVFSKIVQLCLIISIAVSSFEKEFLHLQLIVLASLLVVLLVCAWGTRQQWLNLLRSSFDRAYLTGLIRFGFPLVFSGLAYWGLVATSTIALRSLSTLEELAIYSVASSFAGVAFVFQSIFSVLWGPMVYKWVAQNVDMKIVDGVAQQALAVVCAIVTLSGALSWLCDWVLPVTYQGVKYILLCMLLQPLFYTLSEVTCVGISIKRRTIFSLWITLVALCSNVFLSFLLVPDMGSAGAAIANAVAFTVFFIVRTEVSARIWRQFCRWRLYFCVVALLVLSALMVIWGGMVDSVVLHGTWVVFFLIYIFFFRRQWVDIMTSLALVLKKDAF